MAKGKGKKQPAGWHPPMAKGKVVQTTTTTTTQKKKRNRKKKNGGSAMAGAVSMPAAVGAVVRLNGPKKHLAVVEDEELWAILGRGPTDSDTINSQIFTLTMWPGASGLPRLDNIARQYELYRVRSMTIETRPESSTQQAGSQYTAIDYDASASDRPVNQPIDVAQMAPSVSGPHWSPQNLRIDPAKANRGKWMYTSAGGGVHNGLDAAFRVWLGNTGLALSAVTGNLFAKYCVEFSNPVLPSVTGGEFAVERVIHNDQPLVPGGTVTNISIRVQGEDLQGQPSVGGGTGSADPGWTGIDNQLCKWLLPSWEGSSLSADGKTLTDTWRATLDSGAKECIWRIVQNWHAEGLSSLPLPNIVSSVFNILAPSGAEMVQSSDAIVSPNGWKRANFDQSSDAVKVASMGMAYLYNKLETPVIDILFNLVTTFASTVGAGLQQISSSIHLGSPGQVSASTFMPRSNGPFSFGVVPTAVSLSEERLSRKIEELERRLESALEVRDQGETWVVPTVRSVPVVVPVRRA